MEFDHASTGLLKVLQIYQNQIKNCSGKIENFNFLINSYSKFVVNNKDLISKDAGAKNIINNTLKLLDKESYSETIKAIQKIAGESIQR